MQVNVVDARVRHTRRFHSSRPKKKVSFFFPFLPRRSLLLHPRLTPFSHFSLHLLIYESSLAPFLTLLVSEHHKLAPTLPQLRTRAQFFDNTAFKTDLPSIILSYVIFFHDPLLSVNFLKRAPIAHLKFFLFFYIYIFFYLFIYPYISIHMDAYLRACVCVYIYIHIPHIRSFVEFQRSFHRTFISLSCPHFFSRKISIISRRFS